MKAWYEHTHPICTYNPKRKGAPNNVRLSGRFGPVTKFIFNTFANSLGTKDLIVTIPDSVLRPIPILSYIYATLREKSVIVFTQKGGTRTVDSPVKYHNRNYHLLNKDGEYLFYYVPMGIMYHDRVEAKVYIPRAVASLRKKYIDQQKKNFLETLGPKILLYCDEKQNRIISTIEKIILDDEKVDDQDIEIDLGLVIFENVDRFIHSEYSFRKFLEWTSPLREKGASLLLHFSNPESRFIRSVKDEINALVIPFGFGLLRSNKEIRDAMDTVFETRKITPSETPFLEKYDADREHFYEGITDIEILEPLLVSGNIDYHFATAKSLARQIDEDKLLNKKLFFRVLGLLYRFHSMAVNPGKYKESYGDNHIKWRHYSVQQLLGMLKSRLDDEDKENRTLLSRLISEIHCLYLELKECMRFGEDNTYSRVAKDFRIMELLKGEPSILTNGGSIVLATYSPFERNVVLRELDKIGANDGFDVKTIGQINKSLRPKSGITLVLPGPLRLKYFSELLQPYERILILAYSGSNHDLVEDQIDLFSTYTLEQEKDSMIYLGEVYDFLDVPKDGIFKDHWERLEAFEAKRQSEIPDGQLGEVLVDPKPLAERLKEITAVDHREYREHEEAIEHIEMRIAEADEDEIVDVRFATYYETTLRKVKSELTITKTLPAEKTYLYLEQSEGKIFEGTPRNFRKGYTILILDNDERKTILGLIIDILDLEEDVDTILVESWKKRLAEYIELDDLTFAEVYESYVAKGGRRHRMTVMNWAKGNVLAPEDSQDLLILGMIMGDEQIIEDYDIIDREVQSLRVIHQTTGRKIRRMAKEILKGELDTSKLSYEEFLLYEKIKDGLYMIESIFRREPEDGEDA